MTFGCAPAIFSAYCLLQTAAFMTISFMFMAGITFFTLHPALCSLFQTTLFKKELLAFQDKKEKTAAVAEEQEEKSKETQAPPSPPTEEAAAAKPDLNEIFTPPKNSGV